MSGSAPVAAHDPAVSVVIASSTAGPRLQASLAGVHAGAVPVSFEVLVCTPASARAAAGASCRPYSRARVVCAASDSVPALYAAGLREARGVAVAMTNDRFLPGPGWLAAVARCAAASPDAVVIVAGAIEPPAAASAVARAVFYMEYGVFKPMEGDADVSGAAGANVVYSRPVVAALRGLIDRPTWEYFWHEALIARQASGARTATVRDAAVRVRMAFPWTLSAAIRERFHYARVFAAERSRQASRPLRWARGIGAVLLPLLVLARLVSRHRGDGWPFVSVLPAIAVLTIPWAAGESVGAVAGPGDSLARVSLG